MTVQSVQELAEASVRLGHDISPASTRRNLTVATGRLPATPGALISVAGVLLEVFRPAHPCRTLDETVAPGAAEALRGLAGVACRVVRGGLITVGDEVTWARGLGAPVAPSPDGGRSAAGWGPHVRE